MRAFAAEVLGKTRDPKAIPVLTELVHERYTPAEVEKAAVHALSNFNTPKVIRTLINVATGKTDVSREVRKVAINSLGKIGGSQAVRVLIQILEDSSDEYTVRIKAASALGHTGDPNAIEPLIGALERHKDSYEGIAIAAAESLGKFRDPKVIDALIASLGFGYDYSISRAAAKSLKELRDKRAVEPLIRILDDEGGRRSSEREFAVELLGMLGDPRAVPAIVKALRANDYHVSKAAFESIQPFIPTHPDAILRLPPDDRHLLGRILQDAQRDELLREVCNYPSDEEW
jgi:HEAT repeat protein